MTLPRFCTDDELDRAATLTDQVIKGAGGLSAGATIELGIALVTSGLRQLPEEARYEVTTAVVDEATACQDPVTNFIAAAFAAA